MVPFGIGRPLPYGLDSFLRVDRLLNGWCADCPGSAGEGRTGPGGGHLAQERLELLMYMKGTVSLELLDHLSGAIGGPHPDKQMHMIGLDGQRENLPAERLALLSEKVLSALLEHAR
jgi:hypothetical protein